MTEEPDGRADMRWSPRVPKWKLRRLYQLEAQGIIENSPAIQQTDAAWRGNFTASWWPEFLEHAGVTIEREGESENPELANG